jgi:hypothetical protein
VQVRLSRAAGAAIVILCGVAAAPLQAATSAEQAGLQAQLNDLQAELALQRQLIAKQASEIEAQQQQLEEMKARLGVDLSQMRGTGMSQEVAAASTPDGPVGEAPAEVAPTERAAVQAIPRELGVLTPAHQLVFDPSFEYVRLSTNRLVFRGIELIPGVQIGLIEATDADRDTLVGTASLRYGISNRLEIEGRIPYLYRNDRIEVVQQRDEGIVRNIHMRDQGFGDAEATLRYQINKVRPLHPIWIASLRVKSDTGKSPFEIPFDEFGVATGLAMGSGFWGIQPGVSFLLPSDPVVIYGGLSYFWHIARDIDREIGDVFVGKVDPGDAIAGNVGFGFALNPRFSFSLGYRHNFIFPTESELGDTIQRSNKLHVGQFNFGLSYRVTAKQTVNLGFEFGVTKDAPDVSITLRSPFVIFQ